jgi:hypothetical protein
MSRRLPSPPCGLSVALAQSFEIIARDVKNPQTEHRERAFRMFDLLL